MIIADFPIDEQARLEDLDSYELLDTIPESDFDELVELASIVCKCPISLITLLDKDRQWFKASKGMVDKETSREVAFCSHAILQEKVMIVNDATNDRRFSGNPLVTGGLGIRFYAGAPIISPAGHKLGTICVIDNNPRNFGSDEEKALAIISRQVTQLLALRKKNITIRQRAEEIISIKSEAMSIVMQENRKEKKAMATALHEGLAQEIAASILYLKSAATTPDDRPPFIQTAVTQLEKSLAKIRNLSYTLAPLTAAWIPIGRLVREYLDKVQDTFSFNIYFQSEGKEQASASPRAVLVIHIIEKWLNILATKCDNTYLAITLDCNKGYVMIMEDDATNERPEQLRDSMLASLLKEMAQSEGGTVEFSMPQKGSNRVVVTLPA